MKKFLEFFSKYSSTFVSFGVGVSLAAIVGEILERTITWSMGTLTLSILLLTLVSVYSIINERIRIDSSLDKLESAVPLLSIGNKLENLGVYDFDKDRSQLNFTTMWENIEGCVKIIGLNANDILSSHIIHILLNRIYKDPEFSVQILIVNPWSLIAEKRSETSAYKTRNEFFRLTWSTLLETKDKIELLREQDIDVDRFDVRLYNSIPSLSLIIDSNQILVTPITYNLKGGSSPYFIVKATDDPTGIYLSYLNHFNSIWNEKSSTTLDHMNLNSNYLDTILSEKIRVEQMAPDLTQWLSEKIIRESND